MMCLCQVLSLFVVASMAFSTPTTRSRPLAVGGSNFQTLVWDATEKDPQSIGCPITDGVADFLVVRVASPGSQELLNERLRADNTPVLVFSEENVFKATWPSAVYKLSGPNLSSKYLGAVLAAKMACAGRYRWLLVGGADTFFCHSGLRLALGGLEPMQMLYFSSRLDSLRKETDRQCGGWLGMGDESVCRTRFAWHPSPLDRCSREGDVRKVRLSPLSGLSRNRCALQTDAASFGFSWPSAGFGHIISVGLVEQLSEDFLQKCVDYISMGEGDVRLSACLGLRGFAAAVLPGVSSFGWNSSCDPLAASAGDAVPPSSVGKLSPIDVVRGAGISLSVVFVLLSTTAVYHAKKQAREAAFSGNRRTAGSLGSTFAWDL